MITKLYKWFERVGCYRAASQLHAMGYHDIANNLRCKN